MRTPAKLLAVAIGVASAAGMPAQQALVRADDGTRPTLPAAHEVMNRVIDGLKEAEHAEYLYERVERVETRKQASDPTPQSVRVARVIPAGTGMTKIPLGPDAKPADQDAYRAQLDQLLKALNWVVQSGQPQHEAYQKVQKKQKERDDLIDATRNAFLFTNLGPDARDGRPLSKYRMEPNPAFKPSNRATSIFTKVKGVLWVDDESRQLARIEGEVTEDISFGGFLAKVYKGSHFMQDRYEMAPGLWMPTFTQYDFDGRKLFSSFSVHEKTFYSAYRRVGPPAEAIPEIQSELTQLDEMKGKPPAQR